MSAATRIGKVSQILSLGCAIHCLAMPLLVAVLPVVAMGFYNRVEMGVILASVVLGAASLCWGFKSHRQRRVLILLAAAACLMVGGIFAHGTSEHILVVTGGVTLALSQLLNHRLCKSCSHCQEHECS